MSAVGPERSKIAPTLMSSLVAPEEDFFEALSLFLSFPQETPAPASSVKQSGSASLLMKRFILSPSLGGRAPGRVGTSVSERPYSEVVLGPLPEPGETAGLEQQEDDEYETEQRQLHGGQLADEE